MHVDDDETMTIIYKKSVRYKETGLLAIRDLNGILEDDQRNEVGF